MKTITLFPLLISLSIAAVPGDEVLQRVKIGEAIFAERFPPGRIERLLAGNLTVELSQLEKGAAADDVAKIRKILSDVSRDIASSPTFKDEYSEWLAMQLSGAELQAYLEFLRSDLGRKISDLDDRVQPLFAEAIQRRSKGRLERIALPLAEARSK